MKTNLRRNRALVLIISIWLIIMMTVIVMQMVHSGSMSMAISSATSGQIRARWAARAGVDFAIAHILNDSTEIDSFADSWYDNQSLFCDHAVSDDAVFSIYRYDPDSKAILYGIADEAAKINLTTTGTEDLNKASRLIAPERATDIADFFHGTDLVTFRENNPFFSLRDLAEKFSLSVTDYYGEDTNLNAMLDWNENDGELSFPPDNADGDLQTGIFHFSTVYSFDRNTDSNGFARLNINNASNEELMQLPGITRENALWISENRPFISTATLFSPDIKPDDFNSDILSDDLLADLARKQADIPLPGQEEEIIPLPPSDQVLRAIFDRITVNDNTYIPGLININTAGIEVLASLPEIDRDMAEKIIARRYQLANGYQTPAEIFGSGAINYTTFLKLVDRFTVRSNVFTILVKGKCSLTGQESFAEVVIERNPITTSDSAANNNFRILFWKQS